MEGGQLLEVGEDEDRGVGLEAIVGGVKAEGEEVLGDDAGEGGGVVALGVVDLCDELRPLEMRRERGREGARRGGGSDGKGGRGGSERGEAACGFGAEQGRVERRRARRGERSPSGSRWDDSEALDSMIGEEDREGGWRGEEG